MEFTTIIGLEVHVQLLTESKLFCSCANRFGDQPNTLTCPVCLGLPGVLPVMNRRAFQLSLKAAVALDCKIARHTKWDRKQYYYPDLPKNYQISQYDLPFSHDGYLNLPLSETNKTEARQIGIIRVHLEEDAGKMIHDESSGEKASRVDLNRSGTPLLEIVSQPDIRSPLEARQYLEELKLLLRYLRVSDCNMQEGSLRVDANVNLHIHTDGSPIATPIVEVKNMNSFRAVEHALEYEVIRQQEEFQRTGIQHGSVPKQTRGWDDASECTFEQRSKEEASDYRYLPDPDLLPVHVKDDYLQQVRQSIGELPARLRARFENQFDIPSYDTDVIINHGSELAGYFEVVAETCNDGKLASNWVMQDVLRTLNEQTLSIDEFSLKPDQLGELLTTVKKGTISTAIAREVFSDMVRTGKSAHDIISSRNLEQISDTTELSSLITKVLSEQSDALVDFKNPKKQKQVIGYLTGQVLRASQGKANPGLVRSLLEEQLSALDSD